MTDVQLCDRCDEPATTELVIERVTRTRASIGRSGTRRQTFQRFACGPCADYADRDKAGFLTDTAPRVAAATLQLLVGVLLAVSIDYAFGVDGIVVLAIVLFAAELWHDFGLYHPSEDNDRRTAYARWEQWRDA